MSCCLFVLAVVAAALCCAGLTLGILRGGAAVAVLLSRRRCRPRVPRAQLHAPEVPSWIFIAQLGVIVVVVVACAAALWMW